jgi:hypothetical protein
MTQAEALAEALAAPTGLKSLQIFPLLLLLPFLFQAVGTTARYNWRWKYQRWRGCRQYYYDH